jgi:energy-coupling factor transport system substrate-specific component
MIKKIILTAICIFINIAGHKIHDVFNLPFWLDTVGTALAACSLGTGYGAVTGLFTNLIFGISDSISAIFALVNIGVGVVIGICSKRGMCTELFGVLCTGIITSVFTILCAVPINCIVRDGYINNRWGDALYDLLGTYNIDNIVVKAMCAQAIVDIPDKVISVFLAYVIIKVLSSRNILPIESETGKMKS